MTLNLIRWDVISRLNTAEEQALFLDACIDQAGNDSAFMIEALHAIALAQGVEDLAAFAGVDPESLSDGCELSFEVFLKATHALGFRLGVSLR